MNPVLRSLALLLLASCSTACAEILGTSDYKPCSGESCDDGSGGSGGSGGSTSTSSGTSTGGACFDITADVSGSVKVRLSTIDADFEAEFSGPICAPPGSTTLSAECDQSGGDDPPVAVSWGNAACEDGTPTCTLDLQKDETFTVTAAGCP